MRQNSLLEELSDIESKLIVEAHRAVAKKQAADENCRTSSRERQNVTATAAVMTDKALQAEVPTLKKGIALCRKLSRLADKGILGAYDPELMELRKIANGIPPI